MVPTAEGSMIIPIQMDDGVPKRIQLAPNELENLTLRDIGVTEAVLEEFVRLNIGVLFPEGENLLVVGQQSRNIEGGRADLVAIDSAGNMVLIELKRDVGDIVGQREPFEFQAIRYAASYATLKTTQELVQNLYAPYIERHQEEFELSMLSATELAIRRLNEFLATNNATQDFNRRQRIVLIASSYDPQTLSACAWLAKNGIDIRCIEVRPLRHNQQLFFDIDHIIPPRAVDSFFVELATQQGPVSDGMRQAAVSVASRAYLPRMDKLLEWGVVKPGDRVYIRNFPDKAATIVDHVHVSYNGQDMRLNAWGREVTGWSSMNIYDWAVEETSQFTLGQLREAHMANMESQAAEATEPAATAESTSAAPEFPNET